MTVRFECTTRSRLGREELFRRSLSIDAHVGSMAKSRERAVAGVTSGAIGLNQSVTWKARHFGLPVTMTSRITELESPRYFVDEQVNGPFRSFRHFHAFHDDGGETVMVDLIEFTAPLGVVGRAAERLVLARYLRRLIEKRNEFLVGDAAA